MFLCTLFVLYLLYLNISLFYSKLRHRMNPYEDYWIPLSILVLYSVSVLLVWDSIWSVIAIQLAFAAPFVLLDTVAHTSKDVDVLQDAIDANHDHLRISFASTSIVTATSVFNTLIFGPTVLNRSMKLFRTLSRTVSHSSSLGLSIIQKGKIICINSLAMFLPMLCTATCSVVTLCVGMAVDMSAFLVELLIVGAKNFSVAGLAIVHALARIYKRWSINVKGPISHSLNALPIILLLFRDSLVDSCMYLLRILSVTMSRIAQASMRTKRVIGFTWNIANLSTIHYFIILRIVLSVLPHLVPSSRKVRLRRHIQSIALVFDAIVVARKVYMAFGDKLIWTLRMLLFMSKAVALFSVDVFPSLLMWLKVPLVSSTTLCHRITSWTGKHLAKSLLECTSSDVYSFATPTLANYLVERLSLSQRRSAKSSPLYLSFSTTFGGPLTASASRDATNSIQNVNNALFTLRPNAIAIERCTTLHRKPSVPRNPPSLKSRNNCCDILPYEEYLRAGNCAAAMAASFSEFSYAARSLLSSPLRTEFDCQKIQELETKLAGLADLEERIRKKIEPSLLEKFQNVRRFVDNAGWPKDIKDNLDGIGNMKKHQFSYSSTLFRGLLDLRIELARMDVEIGNVTLKGASDKIRYATDFVANPRIFRPACPDDTDLFDLMALGEVHEEDVLIRNIVAQRSGCPDFLSNDPSRNPSPSTFMPYPALPGYSSGYSPYARENMKREWTHSSTSSHSSLSESSGGSESDVRAEPIF